MAVNILKGEHCVISGDILYRCIEKGVYKIVDKADNCDDMADSLKTFSDARVVDPLKWSIDHQQRKYIK